jgi:mannosyltransferase
LTTTETRAPALPSAGRHRPAGGRRWARGLATLSGRGGLLVTVLALLGAAASIVGGVLSGPLWLDEAQSVAIARLPLGELPQALREDGAPPLYYLLLHAWIGLVGDGGVVVRLPSVALALASLPLVHELGRRLGGAGAGRAALVVLAGMPWWARYASETRMYMLVVVLVLAGALAMQALRSRPSPVAFLGVAAATGALLLTHYWSLFLLAGVGLWHLRPLVRRNAAALRVLAAMVLGSLVFLPWVPTFLYQSAHTGAPWAKAPTFGALLRTPEVWAFGPAVPRTALALAYVGLAVLALRRRRSARRLGALVLATLVLAWTATVVLGGAYAGRYTAVVVPLVALLVALGLLQLRERWQLPALAVLAATGLVTGAGEAAGVRTQGGQIADALRATGAPGDVVLFCPDQLGPSVARLAPEGFRLLAYPQLAPADRVNWVDYAERQAAADPAQLARQVDALAGSNQVYVDFAPGYRTFLQDCQRVVAALTTLRGAPEVEVHRRLTVFEDHRLYRFAGR